VRNFTNTLPPPSRSAATATLTTGTAAQGVVKGIHYNQFQVHLDSFKNNNNNKTLQVISANVTSIPGGIKQSMTGQVKIQVITVSDL
jgi:hypothetical protein